jgi:hypothetical protein
MALAKEKTTKELNGDSVVPKIYDLLVKGSVKIFSGALVALNGGYAAPGATATGRIAAGVAQKTVDNTSGADGAVRVRVLAGAFKFKNSTSTDLIGITEMGKDVFIVDDETVAKTDATGTRSRAGKVVRVDTDGVWVLVGLGL